MHLDTGDLFAENARVLLDAFDPRARMLCAAVYAATLSAMNRPAALAFAALLPGALFFCFAPCCARCANSIWSAWR